MNPSLLSGDPSPTRSELGPFPVNFGRLVGEIAQTFNPLGKNYALDMHVSPARDGHVVVSVAMPEGLSQAFMALLNSLYGLVQGIDNRTRASFTQARVHDPERIEATRQYQAAFRDAVCTRFDALRQTGVPVSEAIKQVNAALKADGHPWASYDLVRSQLSSTGRLRKKGKFQGGGRPASRGPA